MSPKDLVTRELEGLSETDLRQVADYLAFLRFRRRLPAAPPLDVVQTAALYAEAAEEDRTLAEEGMLEYHEGLVAEDRQ